MLKTSAVFTTTLTCAVVLFTGAPASACSFGVPRHFEVDSAASPDDLGVPAAVTLALIDISRGVGPVDLGGGKMGASSCDDLGTISIDADPAAEDVGYVFEVTQGVAPEQLLPDRPIKLGESGYALFSWVDGATDEQEAVDFWLAITPVNRAGVEGPASEPIHIYHPGVSAEDDDAFGGCAQAPAPSKTPAPLLLLGLLAAAALMRRQTGGSR